MPHNPNTASDLAPKDTPTCPCILAAAAPPLVTELGLTCPQEYQAFHGHTLEMGGMEGGRGKRQVLEGDREGIPSLDQTRLHLVQSGADSAQHQLLQRKGQESQ